MDLPPSSGFQQAISGSNASAAGIDPAAGSPSAAKLKKAAQQFEALLLSSFLEQMQKSFSGSLGEENDPASGTLTGLSISAISSALAAKGGIGVTKMVLRQLEPAATTALKFSQDLPIIGVKE